jgi:uncharacterized protein (TIGR04141 family)
MIRTNLPSGDVFQPCDLLGPQNELIYVKRARESSSLSHLFNEAVVACELLSNSAEAREALAARVEILDGDRTLPRDFRPNKVVFAVCLGRRSTVDLESLFSFSQITLIKTAAILNAQGIDVEVIGIPSTD